MDRIHTKRAIQLRTKKTNITKLVCVNYVHSYENKQLTLNDNNNKAHDYLVVFLYSSLPRHSAEPQ